jgi:SHS2 domain-containing protein
MLGATVGRYEVLESIAIADCALEIEGATLDDLFETGARAMAELMVDPATVAPGVARTVTLTAASLDLLFYDWLSELIYLKDSEQLVFTHTVVEAHEGTPCQMTARLEGGVIDRELTALRADPKAVTLHQFALERRADVWWARVIIDI